MEIQATPFRRNAESSAGRRHIAVHLERPAHKGVGTDLVALLYPGHATKRRIFANTHMAPELATVGYNRMSSNFAIVAHVGIRHNQHSIGNAGATAPLNRTTIERTIFANNTVFPNFKTSGFPGILEVLRGSSENGSVVHVGVSGNGDPAIHMHAALEYNSRPDFGTFVHQAPGPDRGGLVDFR